ncbi:hypothetical protein BDV33DRAFT_199448 [Aspergillus novoparasiticus]|uniref:Uncharacterized protein n=1 Tax=Aspergillus novoparasiticus TaxID=986946 RepID=A0A5N6F3K4_9EURO|nr:hypothetical protein BDV33DRAFT_199448 [Aspergillus novoparasiticus]
MQFREDGITPTLFVPETIEPLRNISPHKLTRAAIQDLHLHLHSFKQVASFNNWVQDQNKSEILETFWAVADGQERFFWRCPHQICSSVERTAFPKSTEEENILRRILHRAWQLYPIIVVKLTDGGSTVRYCCVIERDDDPEDLRTIGSKIRTLLHHLPGYMNWVHYTSDDNRVLTDWADFLIQSKSC